VIDPEDGVFGERSMEQPVQRPRRFKTVSERLLDHHPAAGGQRLCQRLDGRREQNRRQREIGRDRPLAVLHGRHHRPPVRHIRAAVGQGAQQAGSDAFIGVAVFLQLFGGMPPELLLGPVLMRQAEDSERLRQPPHLEHAGERRHQVAAREIPGGSENDEGVNHRRGAPHEEQDRRSGSCHNRTGRTVLPGSVFTGTGDPKTLGRRTMQTICLRTDNLSRRPVVPRAPGAPRGR
jgi:hypothetical protein